jgi:hypothetical protein
MAQQGKQMRVGACEGFACNSINWFYWQMVKAMQLIPIRF